jgi:hypothetical protein
VTTPNASPPSLPSPRPERAQASARLGAAAGCRLASAIPDALPADVATGAHRSVGTAFGAAAQLGASGHSSLAASLRDAASAAFFHGFQTSVLVAAGIAVAGAVMALVLIPAQPHRARPLSRPNHRLILR